MQAGVDQLRRYLNLLEKLGLLYRYKEQVSTKYEIGNVLRKMDGTPVLFENVADHEMPVMGNLYSSRKLLALSLGTRENKLHELLLNGIDNPKKCTVKKATGYEEREVKLSRLPIPIHHPQDAGRYITAGVIIAHHERLGTNASYHRMLVIDEDRVVVRIAPRHLTRFLEEGTREVAICIGNPPSVALAAAISVELSKSELEIANAIKRTQLVELEGVVVPPAWIIMFGEFTGEKHEEGPFIDLLGLPDRVRQENVLRIKKIFVREGAIYQTILPGGNEHALLMGFPREVSIMREVQKVCTCLEVKLTEGGRYWLHCIIKIKKKEPDDGVKAILAAFRAHPSLKHVWVVDEDIDINDPKQVEWAMATRFQGKHDMVIREEKGSSLDPSAEEDQTTTKIGFDLTIPADKDIRLFRRPQDIPWST